MSVSGQFFMSANMGFGKAREPYHLDRSVRHLRQKHHFHDEIHFSKIRKGSLDFYFDLVETIATADVRVGGSVYDSRNSFSQDLETWEQQSKMAAQLIRGNVNKGEVVNVFLDFVQTLFKLHKANQPPAMSRKQLTSAWGHAAL